MESLPSIRIIEIDGSDIYFGLLTNTPLVIKNSKDEFHDAFSEILPPNLDLYYLESQGKLSMKPLGDEFYSYDLVNVSFKYPLYLNDKQERVYPKKSKKQKWTDKVTKADIRKILYLV